PEDAGDLHRCLATPYPPRAHRGNAALDPDANDRRGRREASGGFQELARHQQAQVRHPDLPLSQLKGRAAQHESWRQWMRLCSVLTWVTVSRIPRRYGVHWPYSTSRRPRPCLSATTRDGMLPERRRQACARFCWGIKSQANMPEGVVKATDLRQIPDLLDRWWSADPAYLIHLARTPRNRCSSTGEAQAQRPRRAWPARRSDPSR